MMQKSSLSNFCLTNVRNLKVFLEVHGRDIDFAKSEQSYHLTSTDAEAAAVTILNLANLLSKFSIAQEIVTITDLPE